MNYADLDTPRLKYLRMKKEFLGEYLDSKVWGDFGSKEQLMAVTGLLEYLKKTRVLGDEYPHILGDVIVENKELILENILPLPARLYEQLLVAAAGDNNQLIWQQSSSEILAKLQAFLIRKQRACLLAYEHKFSLEVNNFQNYTSGKSQPVAGEIDADQSKPEPSKGVTVAKAKIKKLRNNIYTKIRSFIQVDHLLRKYRCMTKELLTTFGEELSVEEAEIFKNRMKRTEHAAGLSKLNFRKELRHKVSFESTHTQDDVVDTHEHEVLHVEEQECLVLPNVPEDSLSDVIEISGSDPDAEIQRRLTRLKFFSKVWCSPAATTTPVTYSSVDCTDEVNLDTKTSEPNVIEETVTVVSTEKDRLEFNQWYEKQLDNTNKDSKGKVMSHFTASPMEQLNMSLNTTKTSQGDIFIEFPQKPHMITDERDIHSIGLDTASECEKDHPSYLVGSATPMEIASDLLDKVIGSFSDSKNAAITSESEVQSSDIPNSLAIDTLANIVNQQELLNMIVVLYSLQVYMLSMVLTATIMVDKLSKATHFSSASLTPEYPLKNLDTVLSVSHTTGEADPPDLRESDICEGQGCHLSSEFFKCVMPVSKLAFKLILSEFI